MALPYTTASLTQTLHEQWIRYRETSMSLDVFLWGFMKNMIYQEKVHGNAVGQMKHSMLENTWQEILYHFECQKRRGE
jgi:hypothetical protein